MKCSCIVFFIILSVFLLLGRALGEDADYMPSKGLILEYSFDSVSPKGEMKWRVTVRTDDEVEFGGKRYLRQVHLVSQLGPGLHPSFSYLRKTKDGIYQMDGGISNTPNPSLEYLVIPLPLVSGKEWSYTAGTDTFQCKVEDVEDLYLPDRTIKDCVRISRARLVGQDPEYSEEFYAPKLGFAKRVSKIRETVYELVLEPTSK